MGTDVKFGLHQQASPTGVAPQSQTFTDATGHAGDTPKGAIFFGSTAVTPGTERANDYHYIGATNGVNSYALETAENNAVTPNPQARSFGATAPIFLGAAYNNTTPLVKAAFTAFVANGVQVNFTTTTGTARLSNAFTISGVDALFASGILDVSGSGTATFDVDTGWADDQEPDIVLVFSHQNPFDDALKTHAANCIGIAHNGGSITQRCLSRIAASGVTFAAETLTAVLLTTRVCAILSTSGTVASDLNLTAFNAGATPGFSLARSATIAPGGSILWVALKFGDLSSSIFDFDTPTATGNATITLGYQPKMLFLVQSHLQATGSVATDTTANALGISIVLPHREACLGISCTDGAIPTAVGSLIDTKAANLLQTPASATDDIVATGPIGGAGGAFGVTDATLNFSQVASAARKWFGFAVSATSGGGLQVSEGAETSTSATGVLVTANLT